MNDLLLLSGAELARRIRGGEVSSREVVDAHIARIERVNPTLNAVVAERFAAARREADAADRRLANGAGADLPPLHGVPCTVKESFALAGMPNCAGWVPRRDHRATDDAITVRRLRRAGAIPLGVTNTSELCMWMESDNRVYGRTNNPYDPSRIVGGSSGGEGAIVGAGGSPFGLASDIGGSIRMPAFFNGVFGHKPTGGLVPGSGQFPLAENRALRMLSTGPIARRAEDLMPLLALLAGPDGDDPECRPFALGDPSQVRIADLEVIVVDGDGRIAVHPDLLAAQDRAANALGRRGARVVRRQIPLLGRALYMWSALMYDAAETKYRALLGGGKPINPLWELARWIVRRSPFTLPSLGLAALELVPSALEGRVHELVALADRLRGELEAIIGPRGVMLYPPHPRPAPRHGRPLLSPFAWIYTAVFNATELPVSQVPLGLDAGGLPLGVQVVGIRGHDHVPIAVAMALEAECGGWVPPAPR